MYKPAPWPIISRSASTIAALKPAPYLGTDFEYSIRDGHPTITGVSDGTQTVSVPYDESVAPLTALLSSPQKPILVGHNVLTADLPIVEAMLGRKWPVEQCLDTILLWYLTNQHLCKSLKKDSDEAGDKRGRGFMNLWSMCSVHTNFANWKDCRGPLCSGTHCPEHDIWGYNGTDALAPVLAMSGLMRKMDVFQLWPLYELHARLMLEFGRMERDGVRVDLPYVDKLRADFAVDKSQYWSPETKSGSMPFNPESPKQVVAFFKSIGLKSNGEDDVRAALKKLSNTNQFYEPLSMLLDYKELGDGPDRWLAPRVWDSKKGRWKGFVDEDGFIHPHFGPFTSSGRCQCADPNLQNVEKRRLDRKTGEKVGVLMRRAFIAREGHYLVKGDFKSAENMNYLYMADPDNYPKILARVQSGEDFHEWMAGNLGVSKTSEFALALGGLRDASKSVTHATDYGEGLQLKEPSELRTPRMSQEIRAGARVVFNDWTFNGKVVTFTGANLADRAFKNKTWESRAKALAISERYFKEFPSIRSLQRRITKQVERERMVRPPHGYMLKSYGSLEDQLKTALAIWGQQPVAHHIKLAQLNVAQHPHLRTVLTVHDELVCEVDKRHDPKVAGEWLRECMELESPEMPGFKLLTDRTYGDNWAAKNPL